MTAGCARVDTVRPSDILASMSNQATDTIDIAALARFAKAMSHPKRLAILDMLMQGVQCNCEIAAQLGLADSLISHHMRILEEVGLVSKERDPDDARWIYYSVEPDVLAAYHAALGAFLDPARIEPRQPACGPELGRC